jgi:hypothetical protein
MPLARRLVEMINSTDKTERKESPFFLDLRGMDHQGNLGYARLILFIPREGNYKE